MQDQHDRSGPGQSGASSGAHDFDERMPETQPYPTRSVPQGSRESLPGDDDIVDYPMSADDELRARIVAALGEDARGVTIAVAARVVTIAGVVDRERKRRIERVLRDFAGVSELEDRLDIR